jgi:hypothetical protein
MARGPQPYASTGQPVREHRLSVYCTPEELALLKAHAQAVCMRTPAYLREFALNNLPPLVPLVNRECFMALAKIGNLLNQTVRRMHLEGIDPSQADAIRRELLAVQQAIVGLKQ